MTGQRFGGGARGSLKVIAAGAAGVALIAMHLAVGAVLIAGFSRLLPRPC